MQQFLYNCNKKLGGTGSFIFEVCGWNIPATLCILCATLHDH